MAAGPSLFNVVVDSDETAARLMKILEERGLGRVCFMPLNRLRVKPVSYPDSTDVVPLLDAALEYPREVRRAGLEERKGEEDRDEGPIAP